MSAESLVSSGRLKVYAGAVVDADLTAVQFGGKAVGTVCRMVIVGTAGSLAVVDEDGNAMTIPGLAAGGVYPIRLSKLVASGSTAQNVTVGW